MICDTDSANLSSMALSLQAIRVLDINGGGKPDIVISSMVWSNIKPYRILQFLVQQPDGNFKDETDQRLFNYDLRAMGTHQVFIEDVNGDEFPDLILMDSTAQVFGDSVTSCATQGNEVLINDIEGQFTSAIKDSFCKFSSGGGFIYNFNPWFNKATRKLSVTFGDG